MIFNTLQKWDSSYFGGYFTAAHPRCELTKGLICIRFWNGAGRRRQTLLSRRTDLFQAVDPNNPEHISSATTVQWRDEGDSLSTESEEAYKYKKMSERVQCYCRTDRKGIRIHFYVNPFDQRTFTDYSYINGRRKGTNKDFMTACKVMTISFANCAEKSE